MKTKGAAYFLVLLLAWAQADDVWATASFSSDDAPFADADEEYLPAAAQRHREQSPEGQAPAPPGLRHGPALAPCGQPPRGPAAEARAAAPFVPPPLYVFMSLQR
jgi:hypothetical protein